MRLDLCRAAKESLARDTTIIARMMAWAVCDRRVCREPALPTALRG